MDKLTPSSTPIGKDQTASYFSCFYLTLSAARHFLAILHSNTFQAWLFLTNLFQFIITDICCVLEEVNFLATRPEGQACPRAQQYH